MLLSLCARNLQILHIWNFKHIRSSPLLPQSNGLAECVVRSAKHLLEKYSRSHTYIRAAILNVRNLPRGGLPYPAQRLFFQENEDFPPSDQGNASECCLHKGEKDFYNKNAH